ncbi:hypothetical protein CJF42_06685 [Pseudoalteromonas sp. NBT06-2]|uniref:hypothetical protein n=1 Tax=Pseudoalteromonas sp. NBT06-2 TaxID=2025950 RepID=UPI000BA5CE9A|nr:hypothetical protein [Pseudoalteromonas sp. NBT06-2]PAJ75171.1 hypothetical protein CJF42_06685 [Pseudoalteromonas sp. NBT06-2]
MNNNQQPCNNSLAEQIYVANQHVKQIHETQSHSVVLFGDLFAYIFAKDKTNTLKVELAIKQKLNIRKQYLQLLEQYQFSISDYQAAASSEHDLNERFGEGFNLKFKATKKHVDQIYVILMIEHSAEHHQSDEVILHCQLNKQFKRVQFPNLIDGKSQLILEQDSKEYQLLSDPNAKIFLL